MTCAPAGQYRVLLKICQLHRDLLTVNYSKASRTGDSIKFGSRVRMIEPATHPKYGNNGMGLLAYFIYFYNLVANSVKNQLTDRMYVQLIHEVSPMGLDRSDTNI